MSRDINPFGLRLPPALKQALEESAHEARRSLNAEIVARLEASLAQDARQQAYAPDPEELAEIERRAAEWGCSKTQALIRMTIEELEAKRRHDL